MVYGIAFSDHVYENAEGDNQNDLDIFHITSVVRYYIGLSFVHIDRSFCLVKELIFSYYPSQRQASA